MKILFELYSDTRKLRFCTRCLRHFNYERYLKQHEPHCPNEVDPDNLIDALKVTGGYSKEIRKRQVEGLIRHAKKLKEDLQSNDQDETNDDGLPLHQGDQLIEALFVSHDFVTKGMEHYEIYGLVISHNTSYRCEWTRRQRMP